MTTRFASSVVKGLPAKSGSESAFLSEAFGVGASEKSKLPATTCRQQIPRRWLTSEQTSFALKAQPLATPFSQFRLAALECCVSPVTHNDGSSGLVWGQTLRGLATAEKYVGQGYDHRHPHCLQLPKRRNATKEVAMPGG